MSFSIEVMKKLDQVADLVEGPFWRRLVTRPIKYLYGVGCRQLIYPMRQKGINAAAGTIFGRNLICPIPGGMDVFLFGAKTHDSEIRLAKFFIRHINDCGQFIDVGAHIGYFSLLVDALAKAERVQAGVYSIEPASRSFELLKKNTAAFKSIHPFHIALNDESGTTAYYELPDKYAEYNSLDVKQYEGAKWFQKVRLKRTEVESLTLDALIEREKLSPTLIKVDVEGAEYRVIKGGLKSLTVFHPILVMEFLEDDKRNAEHRRAHALLLRQHYHPYYIDANGATNACEDPLTYLQQKNLDSDNIVYRWGA
jgi:FkbM family methyltransferase